MNRSFKLEEIKEVAEEFLSFLEDKSGGGAAAQVIGFSGNLGSGKTTFTKKVLKQLGHVGGAPSPTFVLRRDYDVKDGKKVIHIDAYRLEYPENLWQVISKEEIENPNNLIIIEWPEKIDQDLLDEIFLFEHIDENTRKITKK